jgi:hypothetical protein
MLDPDRHDMQHAGLARMQEQHDARIEAAYQRLKRAHAHAPRKDARRTNRSSATTLYYAWRSHVQSGHGHRLPTRINLDELKALHDRLHAEEER